MVNASNLNIFSSHLNRCITADSRIPDTLSMLTNANKEATAEKLREFLAFIDAMLPIIHIPDENGRKRVSLLQRACRLALEDLGETAAATKNVAEAALLTPPAPFKIPADDVSASSARLEHFFLGHRDIFDTISGMQTDDSSIMDNLREILQVDDIGLRRTHLTHSMIGSIESYVIKKPKNTLLSPKSFQVFLNAVAPIIEHERIPQEQLKKRIVRLLEACDIAISDAHTAPRSYLTMIPPEIFGTIMCYLDDKCANDLYEAYNIPAKVYLACPQQLNAHICRFIKNRDTPGLRAFLAQFSHRHPEVPVTVEVHCNDCEQTKKLLLLVQDKFPNIEELVFMGQPSLNALLELIPACPTLTSLVISSLPSGIQTIADQLPKCIQNITIKEGHTFEFCYFINLTLQKIRTSRCPTLRELHLSKFDSSRGVRDITTPLTFPDTLQVLDISENDFSSVTLSNILHGCRNSLRTLNLNHCRTASQNLLLIPEIPKNLEVLYIASTATAGQIVCLPDTLRALLTKCTELRELDLSNHDELTTQSFTEAPFPKTLQRLILRSSNIDKCGVQHIIRSCPNLSFIDLFDCPLIPKEYRSASFSKIKSWALTA